MHHGEQVVVPVCAARSAVAVADEGLVADQRAEAGHFLVADVPYGHAVVPIKTMMQTASVRTSAPPPTTGTLPAHVDNFNRDVLAVGNAENAIARVLSELRKPQPDNARALKLAQAAMAAVQYVGVEVQ